MTARYPSAGAFWTELDPIFRAAVDGLPYGPTELDPSRATDGRPLAVRPPTDQPPRSEARLSVALPRRDAEQRVSGELPQTSLAWRFRVISPAVRTLRLVRAKVSETGDISAIGPAGLVEWRLSDAKVGWVPVLLPAGVSGPQLRALARLPSGEVFLAGDTALVVRIGSDGKSEAWRLTREPVDFFALDLDPSGVRVVLAGRQAASRDKQAHGVLIEAARGQIRSHHVVAGTEKLRAVRYDDACAIAACGDGGLFARLAPGGAVVQTKLCDGNLYDLAVVPTGGFTIVGSGGYALWITPSGETSIDAVRTTQDLLCVSISDDGAAWAGGRKGRLLYRQNEEWHRIALEPQLEATSVVGIGALQDRILCVFDDGTVVEGLPEAR